MIVFLSQPFLSPNSSSPSPFVHLRLKNAPLRNLRTVRSFNSCQLFFKIPNLIIYLFKRSFIIRYLITKKILLPVSSKIILMKSYLNAVKCCRKPVTRNNANWKYWTWLDCVIFQVKVESINMRPKALMESFSTECRKSSRIALVLLHFDLWLVKTTRATLSTNLMQN